MMLPGSPGGGSIKEDVLRRVGGTQHKTSSGLERAMDLPGIPGAVPIYVPPVSEPPPPRTGPVTARAMETAVVQSESEDSSAPQQGSSLFYVIIFNA
jgi:hypothetical protein